MLKKQIDDLANRIKMSSKRILARGKHRLRQMHLDCSDERELAPNPKISQEEKKRWGFPENSVGENLYDVFEKQLNTESPLARLTPELLWYQELVLTVASSEVWFYSWEMWKCSSLSVLSPMPEGMNKCWRKKYCKEKVLLYPEKLRFQNRWRLYFCRHFFLLQKIKGGKKKSWLHGVLREDF